MLLQSSRFLSRSAATKTCRAATHHLRCCYNSNQPSSSASRTRPPLDPASPATTSICTKVMPAGDESAATAGDGFTSNNVTPVKDEIEPTQSLAEQCERVHKRVYEFLERKTGSSRVEQVQRQTRESLAVVEEALQKFSQDELSFSYNGGKDCLVLLVIYLAALHTHSKRTGTTLPQTLRSVYIVSPNPFPAVTHFVEHTSKKYHLSLTSHHQPMREAFAAYLADNPAIRAIFVGTRRTDPHGAQLTHFDPTDGGWPSFVRIHPVIDWHYTDIWGFIRELGVEYCELYDMGYTSLGGTDDTHPNPALKIEGQEGKFRPAFELVEDLEERLGRDR
ncbi:unnamed protein product [Zymoseptoria tritici ST99CH_1A5]|uniref:FAD synthase n=1 Tax=Zymoseptoria tritici ST99CH_1A5 TaxID=1276529 RepID=A0A1Y6LU36_ZYMTR|nr:unnamed protein product [Zymoseptoria tritici ST99CH_1A5]